MKTNKKLDFIRFLLRTDFVLHYEINKLKYIQSVLFAGHNCLLAAGKKNKEICTDYKCSMNQNKKGTSAMLLTFSSWELLRNVKIGKSGGNAQAVKLSVAN